jgi:OmpA-OmpF porin, OOP family
VRLFRLGFLFLVLLLSTSVAQQQRASAETYTSRSKKAILLFKQGENYFVQRLFFEAIQLLNQSIKKDKHFAEPYFMLGLIYKFQFDFEKSKYNFEHGLSLQPENPKFCGNYFSVAEIYLREGDYDKAESYSQKYLSFTGVKLPYSDAVKKIISDCAFAREQMKTPINFQPKLMPDNVNSNNLQYFPSVTADGKTMVFTTSTSFSMTGNEDLLVSRFDNEGWSNPVSISNKINSTRENEGTATISGDGKTLVFTGCGRRDSKGNCDLYISYKTGEEWTSPVNMGGTINSNEWDSQPSLSADGRTLYFVSLRRGSLGESDIYVSKKKDSEEWGIPVNLGSKINTSENESSPFIHPNGTTLYFATNGKPSMGGMDMYMTELGANNEWTEPKNLGYPLNSSKDDMGLVINTDFSKGYYNSDVYKNGKLFTVLYQFDVPNEIKSEIKSNLAIGTVSDAVTKKKISSKIDVVDLSTGTLVSSVRSDDQDGSYTLVLNEGKEYALYCSQKGYLFKSLSFNYLNKTNFDDMVLNIELEPIKKGAHITLNNIFFESGKYDLQEKSTTELNRLADFLHANPSIKVEISGHTDNVGTDESNMKLSSQRAKSVFDFLISNGIQETAITCKGYGMTRPVAPNTTEENKQLNRRIEFTITE